MSIKTTRIIYWITTILVSVMMISSVFVLSKNYYQNGIIQHLGMPYWFHLELGIGKIIGGLVLLLPFLPGRIKEWVYVAVGIDALSAVIALLSVDGPRPMSFEPLIPFAVLLISYISYHKLYDAKVSVKA